MQQSLIFKYFSELTKVPRPSHYNDKIVPWLSDKLRSWGHKISVDKHGNIFAVIPASVGREKDKSVLLQAHMDMVPVAADGYEHDWKKDPIKYTLTGEWMHTGNTTTLGADDGTGIAYILAVISDKTVSHPKLEVLFTADEEVSPQAISFFDMKKIKADYMINLDGEDFDIYNTGCTSIACDDYFVKNIKRTATKQNIFEISIKGLRGGHSGGDIHMKLANANIAMIKLLSTIKKAKIDFSLVDFSSGRVMNAIPDFANCKISTLSTNFKKIEVVVKKCNKEFSKEYNEDNKINFNIVSNRSSLKPINNTDIIIDTLSSLPNGVISYDKVNKIYSLSSNLWKIILNQKGLEIGVSARSLKNSSLKTVDTKFGNALKKIGTVNKKVIARQDPWTPVNPNKLSDLFKKSFKQVTGKTPLDTVCPGGLETASVSVAYPKMPKISFGPLIKFPHSPSEKLNVKTFEQSYEVLKKVLKDIK